MLGGVWALVAAASVISRLAASGTVLRRARAGAAAAATAYLLLAAAGWLRLVANDSLNIDAGYRRLYAMQGTALVALAAAVAWGWTRRRRTRRRVARLVLDLADAPPWGVSAICWPPAWEIRLFASDTGWPMEVWST